MNIERRKNYYSIVLLRLQCGKLLHLHLHWTKGFAIICAIKMWYLPKYMVINSMNIFDLIIWYTYYNIYCTSHPMWYLPNICMFLHPFVSPDKYKRPFRRGVQLWLKLGPRQGKKARKHCVSQINWIKTLHNTEMIAITDEWLTLKNRRTKFDVKFCIELKEDEQRKAVHSLGARVVPHGYPLVHITPLHLFGQIDSNISFNPW